MKMLLHKIVFFHEIGLSYSSFKAVKLNLKKNIDPQALSNNYENVIFFNILLLLKIGVFPWHKTISHLG